MSTIGKPHQPARSGRDRRSGHERRVAERRQRVVPVDTERRVAQLRSGLDRRAAHDRRRSWVGGQPVAGAAGYAVPESKLSARDRTKARMLPEEFIAATGDTSERLARLIRRRWANAPRQVRAGLVDGLTPILAPLLSGARVTEALRDACEVVVTTWLVPFRR